MRFIRHRQGPDELNITPLIDIVFILLIFFAVSSTFVRDMRIDLERPDAHTAAPASATAVRLYIDREGAFYMDEQLIRPWMLQTVLREALEDSPGKRVLVVADRLTPSERLIEAVDQSKLAGAVEVAVAAERTAP